MKGLEVNSYKSFHWQSNRGALDWVVCTLPGATSSEPPGPEAPQRIPRVPVLYPIVHFQGKGAIIPAAPSWDPQYRDSLSISKRTTQYLMRKGKPCCSFKICFKRPNNTNILWRFTPWVPEVKHEKLIKSVYSICNHSSRTITSDSQNHISRSLQIRRSAHCYQTTSSAHGPAWPGGRRRRVSQAVEAGLRLPHSSHRMWDVWISH